MSSFGKANDVFISFRAEDTLRNFTTQLYDELRKAGIQTYIDNSLEKGDEVWPALSRAIHNSNIAIVVFSADYATSTWCLNELMEILQCRKEESHRQVIIPVFHGVDPSDVRNQTGSYGKAFSKHEEHEKDDLVAKWKVALNEATNVSGWDSRCYENDSQVCKIIVRDVLQKLFHLYPHERIGKELVGIDEKCHDVHSLLSKKNKNQSLENVEIVGIWGMGGMGKTTLARVMFSKLFPLYDSVCFLENIRELSKTGRPGDLTGLRNTLLSELLKDENPKHNPSGSTFNARRLGSKKVLIVLDDVSRMNQLDELCEVYKYAGPESTLIVTTRDRNLLYGRVNEIYRAEGLNTGGSLELFCLNAFKQRSPKEGYEELSRIAIQYVLGVPLALVVLGSHLYSRCTKFWDIELEKLKSYHYDDILNVLQASYDALHNNEQKIFLDIAFFFNGEDKGFVEMILDACGFFATSGIEILQEKALITVSNGRIQMHDLLRETGMHRVRKVFNDTGKCSRLKYITEVYDVLQNKKGSDTVEGITLDLSHIDDLLSLNADTFNMMTHLRFLKLYISSGKRSCKVEYPEVFDKISDNLRYLEWHGYGLKSLPVNFSAKMLVEIHMPYSHLTELWQGVQDVVNLNGINLSECKQLKYLPDLSKASRLKWVNLTSCESLLVLHPSVLSLDTLETLILDGCKKLEHLKSDKHLRSLENLRVNGCTGLKEFSISSDMIERLDLSKTGIEELHSSLGNLPRLKSLDLEGLRLKNLPNCIISETLEDLTISNCKLVMDKQERHVVIEDLMCDSNNVNNIDNPYIDFQLHNHTDQLSFKFSITKSYDKEESDVLDIRIKDCGVHPVFKSPFPHLVRGLFSESEIESDRNLAQNIELNLGLDSNPESHHSETSTAIDRSHKKECNDQNNQEPDLSENCSCDCLFDVLRYLWRRIAVRT